jgi:4-hydroxy-3-methylbut-2-enyl diphosphate reductase
MLVVGSRNSLDSNRLMEVAERYGAEAYLVYDETQIDPAWLSGATRVGITAGASVPEGIVEHIVHALGVLGEVKLSVQTGADETIRFTLPREIRRLLPQKPGG